MKLPGILLLSALLQTDSTAVKYGPWVTDVSETSANILWIGGENTLHSIRLDTLTAGSRYIYHPLGTEIPSDYVFEFNTLDSQADSCRFAMINDTHGDTEMMTLLSADIQDRGFDFLVLGGDISSCESGAEDFLNASIGPLEGIAEEMPIFFARGEAEADGCCRYSLADYFPSRTEGFWYSLRHGPVALLVLDAGPDSAGTEFDAYRALEAEWLQQAVKDSLFTSAPFKVAVMHSPATDMKFFNTILGEAGLDLMISGHAHKYSLHPAGEADNPFPVIVNSCEERLDLRAGANKLVISFNNMAGQTVHRYELRRK